MNKYEGFQFKDSTCKIHMIVNKYVRGNRKDFPKKPEEVWEQDISAEYYQNYITSIPFFNNFGCGASCRASWDYTKFGYLPTRMTTISPNREVKEIAFFTFKDA